MNRELRTRNLGGGPAHHVVILRSEATKNLYTSEGRHNEIFRFAQNDTSGSDKLRMTGVAQTRRHR